jgi:hypothetical protein
LTAGELIETQTGGINANPLLMVELQARALCARLLDKLVPDESKCGPGRPPNLRPGY